MRRRAYRALLTLFPRSFRDERGGHMERLFLDMCAEWEERRGGLGVAFWLSLVWDTMRQAAGEWVSLTRDSLRAMAALTLGDHMFVLVADIRYAVRQLVRQPSHGLIVILLMTLGIAGNAAVFRIFNGLFLKPLPFQEAERLVDIDETAPQWDLEYVSVAYPDFAAWRRDNRTFESMALYDFGGANFTGGESAERVSTLLATHDLDDVLRMEPQAGRFFTAEEDVPDGPVLGLLSEGFWERQYGRDEAVIGTTVQLNGTSVEVIGILPPEAAFLGEADMWLNLRRDASDNSGWSFSGIGRLAPGATIEQARADLLAVHRALADERSVNAEITSPVVDFLRDRYLGDYRLGSGFLLGAVAIVLLIACANIAGLMLARSLTREAEVAVRLAMGAPRFRIVRQLLTESLLLATVGAAAGLALGVWGSSRLVEGLVDELPTFVSFDLDGRVLAFIALVTCAATLVFGLAPALSASRSGKAFTVTGRTTGSRVRRRSLSLLVAGEVALALALLVVGGLSSLDAWRLSRVDPGFDTGVMGYTVALPGSRYSEDEALLAFADEYLARLEAVPGIESAAVANVLPLSGHWGWFYEVEGAPERGEGESTPVTLNRVVSPSYFETMGVDIVAGRALDDFDGREEGTEAAVVNEAFVRTFFQEGEDPVGRRVIANGGDPMTIVGVSRDVKHYGVDEEMRPGAYIPLRQLPLNGLAVALRVAGDADPASVLPAARRVTAEMDPELPLFGAESMAQRLDDALWARRAMSWLIAAFSAVALLLAVAGLYGVISYTVSQRTREVSIRMAVGARSEQVRLMVIRQGMVLVGVGVLVGLGGALAASEVVAGILVGVSPREPLVYAGVTLLLLGVAAVANFVPARRAASLNPAEALRSE